MSIRLSAVALFAASCVPLSALAADDAELQAIRAQLDQLKASYEGRVQALEARLQALQQRLDRHEAAKVANPKTKEQRKKVADDKLNDLKILALAMRAFNFWRAGQLNVRRLDPRMDDPFPRIDRPEDSELDRAA